MDFLKIFFELNRSIIYFAYGLVFFVLGLAIALQSRSYSRLDLARSLKWLAAFGFTHGFNEWGDLFIPIQAAYMGGTAIKLLHDLHLLLLASSFAFLFAFGVTLIRPSGHWNWLQTAPAVLLAVWFFIIYFPLQTLVSDFEVWHNSASALARYFIGFPGALLAGYGLRQHTYQRIQPLNVPHIIKMLKFGGIMLGLYAFFGGLVVPPAPFFPANLLNSDIFEQILAVPPPVFRSMVGFGLAVAIIRALEVFDLETARMIESMEQQQILAAERNRLARDLHDGAIQKVYTAGLMVQSAQKLADAEYPQLASRLEKGMHVLNDAIGDLRRNLGELNPNPSDEPLPVALRKLSEDPRFQSLVNISLDIDLGQEPLSTVRSEHILAVVNEALSNAVRHSRAGRIKIEAQESSGRIMIAVEDNGIGMPAEIKSGYGLRNMRDRARLLDGTISFSTANGKGTRVLLEIPRSDDR